MNTLVASEFNDTDELLDCLRQSSADGFTWYRGQENIEWSLVPGVFRGGTQSKELGLLAGFWERAASLRDAPSAIEASAWVALAQHQGIPTRALDWTEAFLIALYFAIDKPHSTDTSRAKIDENDSAVWLLNPVLLNQKFAPGADGVFSEAENVVHFAHKKAVFNAPIPNGTQEPEVMAYRPRYTHERMVVQEACFTWHGTRTPIDALPDASSYVRLIRLRKETKAQLRLYLTLLGITDSTCFPDFSGLASELKKRV
jgi:hypothetical protein